MSTATVTAPATDLPKDVLAEKPVRRRMRFRNKLLLIVVSLTLMAFLRTGFIFVIIGLLPSIVAYYMDISLRRFTFKTIFCCNLSGLMPFLGELLHHGPSSTVLQDVMGKAANWIIIYGASVIGLMLIYITPMLAHTMITGLHQRKVMLLDRAQKKIETEWGEEVTQFSKGDED